MGNLTCFYKDKSNKHRENFMKRIFILTIASILMLSLLLLSGCDINKTTDGDTHTHAFGEWKTLKEATCTEDGIETRTCSCGESEKETISAFGHTEETVPGTPATCTESGLTDGKKCTVCGEFTVNQEIIPALKHEFVCHTETDENGNIITVTVCQREGCGESLENPAGLYDAENNLIASWDELVNIYGLNGLSGLGGIIKENESLASGTILLIDDSITEVDFIFLRYCTNITEIIIPSSVTSINNTYLESCINLTSITVDKNNEYYKSIDGNLYDKEGKTLIQYASAKQDKEFTIPEGVETIRSGAIVYSSHLEKLYIPASVTLIESHGFSYGALNVYFAGTTEQWEAIEEKIPVKWWMSNNIIIHYDGKMKFVADWFLQMQGSASHRLIVVVEDKSLYLNDFLSNKIYYTENLEIKDSERLLSMFEGRDEEKSAIIKKILANEKWCMCEIERGAVAICEIDGVYYFLTLYIDQTTGIYTVNTIHFAELNKES